jgi:hypothetical protein
MNDIKICKLDGCEKRVLSKWREFCCDTCASIDSYKRNNKRVSDERLNDLITRYTNIDHLKINSSDRAYNEAMKLIN